MEDVILTRDTKSVVEACTWSRGATVVVPAGELAQVRVLAGDLASEFTAALRSANQGKAEATSFRAPEER